MIVVLLASAESGCEGDDETVIVMVEMRVMVVEECWQL